MKKRIFNTRIFINRKTKQASIVLPKKRFEFLQKKKIPKKIKIEIKKIKW